MAKLTKKATQKIIELVQSIKPGTGKNTSFDEAWDIISEYVGIEIKMTCDIKDNTIIVLYKEDKEIGRLNVNNSYIREKGDWDWNIIYKDIIEYMIKNKIVKKPRVQIKKSNVATTANNIYNIKSNDGITDEVQQLKKKKSSLYQKIREWKKKGKDVSELEKEYNSIIESLSNIK